LEKYSHLPITHHWSVHYRPEIRAVHMKVAAAQSLYKLRDLHCRLTERNGRKAKIAWAVAMGKNNLSVDVDWLVEFVGNRPFIVNVTSMGDNSLEGVPPTPEAEQHAFAHKLRTKGLKVQERVNLGSRISASCGFTIPEIVPQYEEEE
jgi:adenine C2-methylase RlmN of 23S rRNA A2503 and tRNA A37